MLALEAAGHAVPPAARCDVFVACVDDSVRAEAFSLVQALRDAGLAGETDHQHRSLKNEEGGPRGRLLAWEKETLC